MHCNLSQPDVVQSLSALISSTLPSSKSLSLSVAVLERFTAYTLRYAVTLNFDPVILTFDLWPWTFVVCRLWRSQNLYEIWAQSGNPRRSYCSLNCLPYELEHVSRALLCCVIVAQSLNSFKLSVHEMWRFYHVNTSWPWPLTPWPWTFVIVRAWCVQTRCKIWAKSNNPLQSYCRFSTLSPWNFWGGRVYT